MVITSKMVKKFFPQFDLNVQTYDDRYEITY